MQMEDATKAAIAKLAELGGQMKDDDDVVFDGTRFVIPASMTMEDAVRFLVSKNQADSMPVSVERTFKYRADDGAICAMRVLRRLFGMSVQVPEVDEAHRRVHIPVSRTVPIDAAGTLAMSPRGNVIVPAFGPDAVFTFGETDDDDLGQLFILSVECPRKMRAAVEGLFSVIEAELATDSIYRSKAFDGAGNFLDLTGVDVAKVTYSSEVMTQLEANVWSMVRHTDSMRKAGISMKRTVLLEGPYGTGKTLAAFLTAQLAVENGWTFLYCRPGKDDLGEVMRTAELYMPAVVFFEDIDVVSDVNDAGADKVSELLDTFDGITSKGAELLAVMTTNHADRIHKGMVRPGRLDAIVHIGSLDFYGTAQLVRNVIPAALMADIDYEAVFDAMNGYMPAFVREALDRAIRYAIARGNGTAELISTADIINAAEGLRAQYDLMNRAAEHRPSDPLSIALAKVVKDATEDMHSTIRADIDSATDDIDNKGDEVISRTEDNVRDIIQTTDIMHDGDYWGNLS